MQSEQIDALAAALAKAQATMEPAAKNKRNPHFNSTYADLASIIEAVRKPLSDNGLAFTQAIEIGEVGLYLSTTLMHTSGQWLRSEYPLLQGTAQQTGSSLTYARRYSLSSIAGIAADEDDDGEAATKAPARQRGEPMQVKLKEEGAPLKEEIARVKAAEITPFTGKDIPPHAFGVGLMANNTKDWRSYATELLTMIRTSGERVAWLQANEATLAEMKKAVPMMHGNLLKAIDELYQGGS